MSDVPAPPPALAADAHKGSAGRALCWVGSRLMPGAALLAARAAQRAGAGLVVVVCGDPELLTIVPEGAPEAVLAEAFDALAEKRALAGRDCHARLFGPGLGDGPRTRAALERVLESGFQGPLVLDADGLNALAGEPERLRRAAGPVVITPHPGEAARLLGRALSSDPAGRVWAAQELAERSGAVVCLKGRGTLVAEAGGGEPWVNSTGNPGMATAGAGDVLAGILVAYLARAAAAGALRPAELARRAVYVHGLAGDLAAADLGAEGLIASDLIAYLPAAQRALRRA